MGGMKWARAAVACVVGGGAALVAVPADAAWTTQSGPYFWVESPAGIEIDERDGSVWIVDHSEQVAYKFDARGARIDSLGGFGTGPGQFNGFSALAIGADGDVYATDVGNARIQRFTADGDYVRSYGGGGSTPQPIGIVVADEGTIYVGDYQTGVHAFAPDGTELTSFSPSVVPSAFALALDHDGHLWVSDAGGARDRVHKLDLATGTILLTLTGFGQATDIEVGPDGRISIVNFNTSTIRTYEPDGTFVEESAELAGVNQIGIDAHGRLLRYGGDWPGVSTMLPDPVALTAYIGPANDSAVETGFADATAGHWMQSIDFDGDGFDHLGEHAFTPIADDHFAAQGITLLGLDARSVGSQPWTNSPPIGAWQQGFGQRAAEPYSFVLHEPAASFGLFLSDVEGTNPTMTVHLADERREFVSIPGSGGSGGARFVGVAAADDVITRVDVDSFGDFHIIDDVRYGVVDDRTTIEITSPPEGSTYRLRERITADYSCTKMGPSPLVSCLGPVPDGELIETGAPGSYAFVVLATDSAGNRSIASHSYTVLPEAIFGLTGVTPGVRAQGSGAHVVTVNGDGFQAGARVRVSGTGVAVSSATVTSAMTIDVQLSVGGSAPLGVRDVTVTNPDGAALTCGGCFTVSAKPTVASVTPSRRSLGLAHIPLTVSGTGFQPGATASFGGAGGVTIHRVDVVDATTMVLDVSTGGGGPGGRPLTVVNPDGGRATKAAAITISNPPTLTSVTPSHVRRGRSATVVLNGTNLAADFVAGGGTVSFGPNVTVSSVVRNSASKLTTTVVVEPGAEAGPRTVSLVDPVGGVAECERCFTIVADPQVGGLAPSTLARGAMAQTVTISGAGFAPGASVWFSGSGVTVGAMSVLDAGTLTASVTVGASAALGGRDVIVTNPDTGTTTCVGCFTVNAKPTIGTLTPSARPRGTTGATVLLAGTGFQPRAVVTVSGTGVDARVVSVSPTQLELSVTVASGAVTGNRSVTVTNPDAGAVTKANAFRIT